MPLKSILICIGLGFAALATNGKAAEITVHSGDGFKLIGIEGKIVAGDEEKFRKIALSVDEAVVILSSNGGALVPALDIGKTIQIRGYATYVPANFSCVSSCALIWAAGSKRLVSRSGRVGFHASYRDNDGRLEEVGVANAIVGRYLTLLNFPERAVLFATSASPSEVSWIETGGGDDSGISFEVFDIEDERTAVAAPPPIQTMPTTSAIVPSNDEPVPNWYYATTSRNGAIYYVRGQDVEDSRASSRFAQFWVKTDDSKDATVNFRSSMTLYNIDCVSETYRMEESTVYDRSGVARSLSVDRTASHVVPDSVFSTVTALICSDKRPISDDRDIP